MTHRTGTWEGFAFRAGSKGGWGGGGQALRVVGQPGGGRDLETERTLEVAVGGREGTAADCEVAA